MDEKLNIPFSRVKIDYHRPFEKEYVFINEMLHSLTGERISLVIQKLY